MAITIRDLDGAFRTAAGQITTNTTTGTYTGRIVNNTNATVTFNDMYTNTWTTGYNGYDRITYDDFGWDQRLEDYRRWYTTPPRDTRTPEEIQEAAARLQRELDERQYRREEQSRRRLERAQREEENRQAAHNRGLEVLEWILTPEEREQWAKDSQVVVKGSEGNLYRVNTSGVHGNLTEVDEHGCELAHICVAPQMYVGRNDHEDDYGRVMPSSDGWVGQILMIKNSEREIQARGNYSRRNPCRRDRNRTARINREPMPGDRMELAHVIREQRERMEHNWNVNAA